MTVSGSVESQYTTFFQKKTFLQGASCASAMCVVLYLNVYKRLSSLKVTLGKYLIRSSQIQTVFPLIVVSELLIETAPSRASSNHPVIILSSPFFSTDDHFRQL